MNDIMEVETGSKIMTPNGVMTVTDCFVRAKRLCVGLHGRCYTVTGMVRDYEPEKEAVPPYYAARAEAVIEPVLPTQLGWL